MLLGKKGTANAITAATHTVDQLPGTALVRRARRIGIGKGRTGRFLSDRLGAFAALRDAIHARLDGGGLVWRALENRRGEDPVFRGVTVTIGIVQLLRTCLNDAAQAVDRAHRNNHILGFLVITAGIHAQCTADHARNPDKVFHARQTRFRRGLGDHLVQRTCACFQTVTFEHLSACKRPGQANDNTADAAIPHQRVRACAQHMHRNVIRRFGQETRQIRLIGRQIHHIRRTTDPKPGNVLERRVFDVFAANGWKAGQQTHHYLPPATGEVGSPEPWRRRGRRGSSRRRPFSAPLARRAPSTTSWSPSPANGGGKICVNTINPAPPALPEAHRPTG